MNQYQSKFSKNHPTDNPSVSGLYRSSKPPTVVSSKYWSLQLSKVSWWDNADINSQKTSHDNQKNIEVRYLNNIFSSVIMLCLGSSKHEYLMFQTDQRITNTLATSKV